MAFSNSQNNHIDALFSFVRDIKPFHVKLASVVNEYVFEDVMSVKFTEENKISEFFGADIVDPAVYFGTDRPVSSSWRSVYTSNGVTSTYTVPYIMHPKFYHHFNAGNFVCGVDDVYAGSPPIPGMTSGLFDQVAFDGPGINVVTSNGTVLQEGEEFNIVRGAYSFDIYPGITWGTSSLEGLTEYPVESGALEYADITKTYGTITDIVYNPATANYDEWILECVAVNPGAGTATLTVTGSETGPVGNATFDVPFIHAGTGFGFTFTSTFNDAPGTLPAISVGQKFVLTPNKKFTIHPTADEETWTIIKTNPITVENVTFSPVTTNAPGIQVNTRSLYFTEASSWEIVFDSLNTYVLTGRDSANNILPGYPKNVELINGCAYKDDNVSFSLIASDRGWQVGDTFTFSVTADKPIFRVFGSVTGFTDNAELDKWYWNGSIGFKIPSLEAQAFTFTPNIAISTDGLAWTSVNISNQNLTDVDYVANIGGSGGLVLSGGESVVASSINAQNWTSNIHAVQSDGFRAVVVGDDGFIAMTTLVATADTPAFEWYVRNSNTVNDLNGLIFIPGFYTNPAPDTFGMYVAVGNAGTILTSANGDAWANQISGVSENLNDASFSSTQLVVVGNAGTILTSPDALTWTARTSGTTNNLNTITFMEDQNMFIAGGDVGTVITSPDGITWTASNTGTTENILDIAYNPIANFPALGQLSAVATGNEVLVSVNGALTWASATSFQFNSVTHDGTQFVAVGLGQTLRTFQFAQNGLIHGLAEPSVYQIDFVSKEVINSVEYIFATVKNNIKGYLKGIRMVANTSGNSGVWTDGDISFNLLNGPKPFNIGDAVRIYTGVGTTDVLIGNYDELPYELSNYDSSVGEGERRIDYLKPYIPFYHSQDSVIIENCVAGDEIVIDKAFYDAIRLKITPPAIGPLLDPILAPDENGWIPLEFRYGDRIDSSGNISSVAEFGDLATRIDAYLGADPERLVFTLTQKRYGCSDVPGSCVLTFDPDFLSNHLADGSEFTILSMPNKTTGDVSKIKITEKLRIRVVSV